MLVPSLPIYVARARSKQVFDSVSGREVRSMRTSSSCNALDVSADGATIVSAHLDGSVRLWDVGSGSQVMRGRA